MRSTGAVSTLRVAVTAPWAIASDGTSRRVIRTIAITLGCHFIVPLLLRVCARRMRAERASTAPCGAVT
jgi:hypothetical protein